MIDIYFWLMLLLIYLLLFVHGIKKSVPSLHSKPIRYNKECLTIYNAPDSVYSQQSNVLIVNKDDNKMTISTARSLLLLASFFHAIDYSFTKIIQRYLRPEIANSIRYLIATSCFLPDLMKPKKDTRSILIGMELGIWCGLASVSLGYNLQQKPAGKVAFVGALGVLMPPMFNFMNNLIFSRKSINVPSSSVSMYKDDYNGSNTVCRKLRTIMLRVLKSSLIGPFLAICGAAMLESDESGSGSWSDLLMILTPLFYAYAVWRTEKISNYAPYDFKLSSGIMLSTASLLSSTCALIRYGLPSVSFVSQFFVKSINNSYSLVELALQHWKVLALMISSSLLCLGWPTLAEQTTLQMISSTEAYILLSMEPIFAIICARLILGEVISPTTWIAAAFIISACLWSTIRNSVILVLFSYSIKTKKAIE